ncbi:MAG: zf-HC2 domain-containing protein [Burkholderiales bacterium]|nr:zf-HC2 domain-containing protein [Burkholderiales bacterium]
MNLMHSCKQVAQLLTRACDEPLGIVDKLRLRLHLAMCENCSNIAKQLDGVKTLTEDMFGDFGSGDDEPAGPRPGTTG